MDALATRLIAACGGTTEVSKLVKASTSTVHSWKEKGLSPSRLDHLRLAAQERGLNVDFDAIIAEVVVDRVAA